MREDEDSGKNVAWCVLPLRPLSTTGFQRGGWDGEMKRCRAWDGMVGNPWYVIAFDRVDMLSGFVLHVCVSAMQGAVTTTPDRQAHPAQKRDDDCNPKSHRADNRYTGGHLFEAAFSISKPRRHASASPRAAVPVVRGQGSRLRAPEAVERASGGINGASTARQGQTRKGWMRSTDVLGRRRSLRVGVQPTPCRRDSTLRPYCAPYMVGTRQLGLRAYTESARHIGKRGRGRTHVTSGSRGALETHGFRQFELHDPASSRWARIAMERFAPREQSESGEHPN
ncbi:hypothetical protein MSAN_01214700 [Mycena sanguinolenta]|uniref:Uncharacterized protein n=1 Tax=Mycena sanguinolenta TaxID=230812 RepID=A0A8H6YGL9_9AGAR|nr:hypothetical protein MSAN_01214700 [Mycena sanguinolenta]